MIPEIYLMAEKMSGRINGLHKCLENEQSGKRPLNPEENVGGGLLITEFSTDSVDTFLLVLVNESGQGSARINHR